MKRKIAGLLSLTMILSSMSINAFADTSLPADGATTAAGTAGVNAINTTVYRLVLPTEKNLNYIADPQGLAQLGDDGSQVITDLTGGNVYSKGDVTIANRSSKDITVTAKVTSTKTQTYDASDDTKKLNSDADVVADDATFGTAAPELKLAVVVSEPTFEVDSSGATIGTDTGKYKVETSTATTANNKKGFPLVPDTDYATNGKAEVEIPITLKKADYTSTATTTGTGSSKTTTYSYDVVSDSVGGAVTFSIAGKCSTTKWDDKTSAPDLEVVYNFAEPATEVTFADDTKLNYTAGTFTGLQTSPVVLVNVTGATISKTDKKVSFTLFAGDDDNAAVKTNWSDKAATVQSLTVDGTTKAGATISVADDGTISVAHDDLETVADKAEVVAKVLYDGKIYIAKLTVPETPADTAPSTSTTGTFSKTNGITLSINLGSGTKVATGISKVEVSKTASGDYVELSSDKWSYNSGTLTASGTWGGCSVGDVRLLRITFIDSDNTQAVVSCTIAA